MKEYPEPSIYPRGLGFGCAVLVLAVLLYTGIQAYIAAGDRSLRSRCPSELKQILYACQLYSGDNAEAFPPDLGALMPDYFTYGGLFLCTESRAPVRECRVAERGAIKDENLSFCYVSGLTAADDPGYVLVFDEEWNHEGKGAYLAYIGGRVCWQKDIAALHERLARQKTELKAKGREMKVLRPSWSTWPERPPWVPAPSRFWWIAGGSATGVLLLAAAVMLFIVLRRRRRRLAAALADST
ncbi:MAG: hypothetical protein ACYTKD_08550 [Planctomycetota bacterium]|jgi:hypothetical protein